MEVLQGAGLIDGLGDAVAVAGDDDFGPVLAHFLDIDMHEFHDDDLVAGLDRSRLGSLVMMQTSGRRTRLSITR